MPSTSAKIYLDHAAATPLSTVARRAMARFEASDFYNPSAPYRPAVEVRAAYEAARAAIAQAIGAKATDLILTAGATEANQLALAGFARVYCLADEHPSILAHATDQFATTEQLVALLAEQQGARRPSCSATPRNSPRSASNATSCSVVSISLINSETGLIRPVAELAAAAHQAGMLLHLDASQAATTMKLNVARLGADLLTLNSGKIYGPKQVGALYRRPGVELAPLVLGGGQESGLRSGTENVAGVIGFAAALVAAQAHCEAERKRLEKLKQLFRREFRGKYLFDTKQQSPGFLVIETGLDAERLVYALEVRGVLVGTGAACAANKREVSRTLGGSALRLSFGKLNDEVNIKQAAQIIREEIERERARPAWGTGDRPKVIVGLSGGVDSSVSAALLLEQGYDVKGVYMRNWSRDLPGMKCPWKEDLADAKRVATQLGIDFAVWDFEKEYYDAVVKTFVEGAKQGLTPNPDILCNQSIKFKLFLERAEAEGAGYLATGHYAALRDGKLVMPQDLTKDQTYFLYRMPRAALKKVLFPLAGLEKTAVKARAAAAGFRTASKKESMGICFVGEADYAEFLGQFIAEQPGEIVEQTTGRVLGQHKGVAFYTLGQRHGLYLGGGAPYYVVGKDLAQNQLLVSRAAGLVEVDELALHDWHWLVDNWPGGKVQVRTRHLGELIPAEWDGQVQEGGETTLRLARKTRAVAPGQSVVLYDQTGICLGGGVV